MPMIITMPYGDLVMPIEDAITVAKIFEKAEKYRCKYNGAEGATHHIFPMEDNAQMRMITDDTYAMYKLAGKPED